MIMTIMILLYYCIISISSDVVAMKIMLIFIILQMTTMTLILTIIKTRQYKYK